MRTANLVHKDVFVSSQAESVTKNSFTLSIVHCCHFQSSPCLSLCSGPSIIHCCHLQSSPCLSLCSGPSIPGTGLLEFCVAVSAVSFSETRRNHKGPNQVRKEGLGVIVHSGQNVLH